MTPLKSTNVNFNIHQVFPTAPIKDYELTTNLIIQKTNKMPQDSKREMVKASLAKKIMPR